MDAGKPRKTCVTKKNSLDYRTLLRLARSMQMDMQISDIGTPRDSGILELR
jgi:hypothetical protein